MAKQPLAFVIPYFGQFNNYFQFFWNPVAEIILWIFCYLQMIIAYLIILRMCM